MNKATKGKPRVRHVPQRTCVACREVRPKREMVRIVRTPTEGIQIDPTGKRAGRGAYLHEDRACWEAALAKGRLAHALKTEITTEERQMLEAYAARLREDDHVAD